MNSYGEMNGVKFRVNHNGPLNNETYKAIKKMVCLASKIKTNPNDSNRQADHKN